MYETITGENPYEVPMHIYPASHYTMGGLWVDYNLMSNIPGLFVLGEANFSDHGANRLGASALMQGLADGYFIIPYTIGNYLAESGFNTPDTNSSEFEEAENGIKSRISKLLSMKGKKTARDFHAELGLLIWDKCGMSRNEKDLKEVLGKIPSIREEFWENLIVSGKEDDFNQDLERAIRVADFLEFAEVFVNDALDRKESCGGHFREESQTDEGEAKRDDENFTHVAAWEYKGNNEKPVRHQEELEFETVELTQRSYK